MTDFAPTSLSKVEYSSYWRQLTSMDPSPAGMVVCNDSGTVLWANDELAQESRESTTHFLERLIRECPTSPTGKLHKPANGSNGVHAAPVHKGSGELIGLIGIVLPTSTKMKTADITKLQNVIRSVAENVSRESDLIGELDAMADELALRYEELNLLYNIADDGEAEPSECEQALSDLVRSCGHHLDASIVAVILPKQEIFLSYPPRAELPERLILSLNTLEQEVCPWVSANRRQLVLNEKGQSLHAAAASNLKGKLMACPVMNELGTAHGIFAVLRNYDEANFTTGDRRLLEVVTTKAEKVVQLSYDPLTGLMNRNEFLRKLDRSLAAAHSRGAQFSLLVMEIEHLKIVNDAFGHEAGDALLTYVTETLRAQLENEINSLARLGGDHFAILIPGHLPEKGRLEAKRLARAISATPFSWRESRRNITVSVGLGVIDRHTQRAKTALYSAEIACDVASGLNTDRVAVYNEGDPLFLEKREDIRWVGLIQDALRNDNFSLYCQKIAAANKAGPAIEFNEILLRLRDDSGGVFTPGHFMPAAERFYLMPEIDRWVVRKLLQFVKEGRQEIGTRGQLWSVNLSGQSLSDDGFLGFVTDELNAHGISPECICFEVTETAAVTHIDRAQLLIDSLRAIGCRFALDDFGTGLSSFGYLKSLHVDHIKIDGSFVSDILLNRTSEAVVSGVVHLGHVLGIRVTAEWVESEEIKDKLKELGVDFFQGYGVGKPIAVEDWLRTIKKGIEE